jgi:release factor glutamine methyltransferase
MLKSELQQYLSKELVTVYDADETAAIVRQLFEFYVPEQSGYSEITPTSQTSLEAALTRLKQHEPLQYVLGEAWFYDLPFYVNSSVLIPRPETEELVYLILSGIRHSTFDIQYSKLKILDIGTGSGCIPVVLKKNIPDAEVHAIDISPDALTTAKQNAERNETAVDFIQADILDPNLKLPVTGFDVIVSNPPYITNEEKAGMHPNVLSREPHLALFVSNGDPLQFYKTIAAFASRNLIKGGKLYVEINAQFGHEVKRCFESYGFSQVTVIRDMQGKERIVTAVFL